MLKIDGLAPLIEVSGASRIYRSDAETVYAARDVHFTAYPGEFVCLYGASGSGKSTLLNLLAGLDVADAGTMRVAGIELTEATEQQRTALRLHTVGVVFQDHNLIEEFSAIENVALPLEATGRSPAAARAEAAARLEQVGLEGLESRFPHQLSGGQRQRVGIARALVGGRSIVLADEPTGALDSQATASLFQLIRALCDDGLLAVVCSHDPHGRELADSVYEVVDGRVTECSPV